MKELKIEIPNGYEIDHEKSSLKIGNIVFKETKLDIMERIKTLNDAVEYLGDNHEEVQVLNLISKPLDSSPIYNRQALIVIIAALNDGWVLDYSTNDYAYYPVFYKGPRGFSLDCVSYLYSGSIVPPPFVFKTKTLAEYASTQFIHYYKAMHKVK